VRSIAPVRPMCGSTVTLSATSLRSLVVAIAGASSASPKSWSTANVSSPIGSASGSGFTVFVIIGPDELGAPGAVALDDSTDAPTPKLMPCGTCGCSPSSRLSACECTSLRCMSSIVSQVLVIGRPANVKRTTVA
jgi:hypothetical protein